MIRATRKPTATYLYVDDEQNIEFTCELEFDFQPAEPEVGLRMPAVAVTEISVAEAVVYIGDLGAELKHSVDAKTGWESVVARRLMHLYENCKAVRDEMDEACFQALADEEEDAAALAEYQRECEADDLR